jgi:hypothetical protein
VPAVRAGEEGCVNRIGGLLSPLLKGLGIEEAVRLEGIKGEWTNIFREPLSLHMHPSRLKNGELLINVDSAVWLQQISFYRAEIIGKLGPFGIKDVRFRIGRAGTGRKPQSERPQQGKSRLDGDAMRQIEETVSGMEDSPVKESIRRAMAKALAKKNSKS